MVEEAEDSLKMSACGETTPPLLPPQQPKKKRNLPGMPDPDAEVVALSPKTLLATNRFVCEICGKGFQRDQNLQLHRRGHNLPWKLKQRSSKEPRKRVYVCPEPSCVHHNAGRALGDLTGIKKHFSRKHGEKKWKCERCSKKYAVQSDWKAHMKTCGTREYKCDCGTLFSRRDSFITHRAFCDVLAEESMRRQGNNAMVMMKSLVASPPPPPLTPSTTVVSPGLSVQSSELAENQIGVALSPPVPSATPTTTSNSTNSGNNVISTIFASSSAMSQQPSSSFSSMMSTIPLPSRPVVLEPPPSLSLSSSLYLSNSNNSNPSSSSFYAHNHQSPVQPPAMSATALLQKAAQMGAAATSNASFLCSLGLPDNNNDTGSVHQWDVVKQEHNSNVAGEQLGLGLHHSVDGMMGSSIFGSKPTTLDFLGLGMDRSALLNSYGGGFHVRAAAVAAAAAAAEAFGGGGGGGGGRGNSTSEETWDGSRNEAAASL